MIRADIEAVLVRVVKADVEAQITGRTSYEHYKGSYEVTPQTFRQSLETKSKVMDEDVEIKSIPYYEVSNPKGYTVYIGSEI